MIMFINIKRGNLLFKKYGVIAFLCLIGFSVFSVAETKESDANSSETSDAENECKNDRVACYGIADSGQNENVISPSIDGHVYGIGEAPPCHPEAYICLPKGTDCSRIIVAQDKKLNYVRGSGEPNFDRPQVDFCYPYNYADEKPMFPNPDWKREVDRI